MSEKWYEAPEFHVGEPAIPDGSYDPFDYGAHGDGLAIDTAPLQACVDAAHRGGGGRVVLRAGTFLSGTIRLKSRVELHIEEGATLLGSVCRADYEKESRWFALLLADSAHDIAITGAGTIDGRGRQLALDIDRRYHRGEFDNKTFSYNARRRRPNERERPQIIEMSRCDRIRIADVTIRDAACWVQTYVRCRDLVIDRIWVDSDAYWNNDGIDIEDCTNVRITNCDINSADDGICLKSEHESGNRRVVVSNCRIRSSANAIKFGTTSFGGFRDVLVRDITVFDTYRSAIALECVDGGVLENVEVRDVVAWNTANAIFVRLGRRNAAKPAGLCRTIRIARVKVHIPFGRPDTEYNLRGPGYGFFHNPIPASITGIPGHPVEDMVLEDIELHYPGRSNPGLAHIPIERLSSVPEREDEYPEFTMFEELPSWGLYCRHVKGITMRGIIMRLAGEEFRPACVFDDVNGVVLAGIDVPRGCDHPHIVFRNVESRNVDEGAARLAIEVE